MILGFGALFRLVDKLLSLKKELGLVLESLFCLIKYSIATVKLIEHLDALGFLVVTHAVVVLPLGELAQFLFIHFHQFGTPVTQILHVLKVYPVLVHVIGEIDIHQRLNRVQYRVLCQILF